MDKEVNLVLVLEDMDMLSGIAQYEADCVNLCGRHQKPNTLLCTNFECLKNGSLICEDCIREPEHKDHVELAVCYDSLKKGIPQTLINTDAKLKGVHEILGTKFLNRSSRITSFQGKLRESIVRMRENYIKLFERLKNNLNQNLSNFQRKIDMISNLNNNLFSEYMGRMAQSQEKLNSLYSKIPYEYETNTIENKLSVHNTRNILLEVENVKKLIESINSLSIDETKLQLKEQAGNLEFSIDYSEYFTNNIENFLNTRVECETEEIYELLSISKVLSKQSNTTDNENNAKSDAGLNNRSWNLLSHNKENKNDLNQAPKKDMPDDIEFDSCPSGYSRVSTDKAPSKIKKFFCKNTYSKEGLKNVKRNQPPRAAKRDTLVFYSNISEKENFYSRSYSGNKKIAKRNRKSLNNTNKGINNVEKLTEPPTVVVISDDENKSVEEEASCATVKLISGSNLIYKNGVELENIKIKSEFNRTIEMDSKIKDFDFVRGQFFLLASESSFRIINSVSRLSTELQNFSPIHLFKYYSMDKIKAKQDICFFLDKENILKVYKVYDIEKNWVLEKEFRELFRVDEKIKSFCLLNDNQTLLFLTRKKKQLMRDYLFILNLKTNNVCEYEIQQNKSNNVFKMRLSPAGDRVFLYDQDIEIYNICYNNEGIFFQIFFENKIEMPHCNYYCSAPKVYDIISSALFPDIFFSSGTDGLVQIWDCSSLSRKKQSSIKQQFIGEKGVLYYADKINLIEVENEGLRKAGVNTSDILEKLASSFKFIIANYDQNEISLHMFDANCSSNSDNPPSNIIQREYRLARAEEKDCCMKVLIYKDHSYIASLQEDDHYLYLYKLE